MVSGEITGVDGEEEEVEGTAEDGGDAEPEGVMGGVAELVVNAEGGGIGNGGIAGQGFITLRAYPDNPLASAPDVSGRAL